MLTAEELLQELEQETHTTRRVLERVPPDRLDWRPHPKSLTLGQLAMHVATIPGVLTEIATLPTFNAGNPIPRPGTSGVPELLATLETSVAKARSLLGAMDAAALMTPWRAMMGEREIFSMPRSVFIRSTVFNHWYHHRGQLTVYLRETGALIPSIYGPSADESMAPA